MGRYIRQTDLGHFIIGTGYYNQIIISREVLVEILKTIRSDFWSLLEPAGLIQKEFTYS